MRGFRKTLVLLILVGSRFCFAEDGAAIAQAIQEASRRERLSMSPTITRLSVEGLLRTPAKNLNASQCRSLSGAIRALYPEFDLRPPVFEAEVVSSKYFHDRERLVRLYLEANIDPLERVDGLVRMLSLEFSEEIRESIAMAFREMPPAVKEKTIAGLARIKNSSLDDLEIYNYERKLAASAIDLLKTGCPGALERSANAVIP